mgnify:CR=1 FL=1
MPTCSGCPRTGYFPVDKLTTLFMFLFCSLPPGASPMDIPAAINLNKTALLRIVAGLFALLEAAQARIPLALHRRIARVLRPAESAARRLIVTFARITNLKAPPSRSRRPPAGLARGVRGKRRRAAFPLFDPRQQFSRKRRARAPRIRSLAPGAVHGPRSTGVRDTSDGMETSDTLLRRLAALKDALENLPRQARRLPRQCAGESGAGEPGGPAG